MGFPWNRMAGWVGKLGNCDTDI